MIIECVTTLPSLPQSVRLRPAYRPGEQEFPVEIGTRYHAFGVRLIGAGVWVYIETEGGYLVATPLALFRIIDGSLPTSWRVSTDDAGDVLIAAEPLTEKYFIDDLASGVTAALTAFAGIKRSMGVE